MNNPEESTARKVIIKTLKIYSPLVHKNTITKTLNDDFHIDNYLHFPIVLNNDNTQWEHANRYLLYKLKNYNEPTSTSLNLIANDLVHFKRFCDQEDVNYLSAPRKILRPNWLYRKYLHDKVNNQEYSIKTIKRKLNSITKFYEWLINIEEIKFKFELWTTSESFISYKDDYGFNQNKKILIKDITTLPQSATVHSKEGVILDGGKLKPLIQKEQITLFKALKESKNIEMKLLFLIAITTGARMQTACTLRMEHFNRIPTEEENEIRIKIGYGTNCDTKYSKQNSLFLPKWVYEKIRIYINSPKALLRRKKSKHIFNDEKFQYVFLTNRGRPLYVSKNDPYRNLYHNPPSGENIRVFIANTLLKNLKNNKSSFKFSFHDLRATFGMNYVDQRLSFIKDGSLSLTQLLTSLKDRMGHARIETTELYLNFRKHQQISINAQNNYEKLIRKLLNE